MRKRIDTSLAQRIVELSSSMMNKDIAPIVGISESTVSRVLRQRETYLDEETDWWFDKMVGKRCFDCGIIFAGNNGQPVLCEDCFKRRQLLGLKTIKLSKHK